MSVVKNKFMDAAALSSEKYDEMLEEIKDELARCRYSASTLGIEANLNKMAENKAKLFNMVRSVPAYNGNLQCVYALELDPEYNRNAIVSTIDNFLFDIGAREKVLTKLNDAGRTREDIIRDGAMSMPSVMTIPELEALKYEEIDISDFDCDGYTRKSVSDYNKLEMITNQFRYNAKGFITGDTAEYVNAMLPEMKAVEGMKTSKLFNRVFNNYKLDTYPEYNKRFAIYSDMVATGKRKMLFVISVNPMDYITCSHGVSWNSCHSTEGHGNWHAGNWSYMNDGVSFVTYVVPITTDPSHPEFERKVYRCNFHYKDGYLVQPRVYPQNNDGNVDLYKEMRHAMQRFISEAEGREFTPNSWVKKSDGTDIHEYARSGPGYKQYEDYFCQSGRNISYLRDMPKPEEKMVIGVQPYCIRCGGELGRTHTLYCGDYGCHMPEEE